MSDSTRFESLSNDLLFDIFEYLDVYSLFNAFSGLNGRLNELLRSTPVHYESNRETNDANLWNSIATMVKPSQIRSIVVSGVDEIDERFINAEVTNVKTLILRPNRNQTSDQILGKLPTTLNLENFSHFATHRHERYTNLATLTLLFKKHSKPLNRILNASLSSSALIDYSSFNAFPRLRRLHLDLDEITSNLLQTLRDQTPTLKSLRLIRPLSYPSAVAHDPTVRLEHVQELDLNWTLAFPNLCVFLSSFPNLTKLRVVWPSGRRYMSAPDGSQWQNLLEKTVPKLERFTLEFTENGTDASLVPSFFTGDFWSKHPVHLRRVVAKSRQLSPRVKTIYFGREWRFHHFDGTVMSE